MAVEFNETQVANDDIVSCLTSFSDPPVTADLEKTQENLTIIIFFRYRRNFIGTIGTDIKVRERIMTEALSLMNEQGMNFTVAELACALAVSKRTIYQHFESKNHLVASIVDEILLDLREQIDIIERSGKLRLLDKMQQMMLASPKALGPLSPKIITDIKRFLPGEWGRFEAFFEEKWRRIELIVRQGTVQGIIRPINFEIVKKIYRGSINELGDFRFLTQSNYTFQNTMEKTVEILLYGIVNPGSMEDSAPG